MAPLKPLYFQNKALLSFEAFHFTENKCGETKWAKKGPQRLSSRAKPNFVAFIAGTEENFCINKAYSTRQTNDKKGPNMQFMKNN